MAIFGPTPQLGLGSTEGAFKSVLTKLASDKGYLRATVNMPKKLLEDFPELTIQELDALRDAAILSGADLSNIDPLHAGLAKARPGSGATLGGNGCCCCCCCGTTAA